MAGKTQGTVGELYREADELREAQDHSALLDKVLEQAERKPVSRVPAGFAVLARGVLRKIRVNRNWIVYGDGRPFIIVGPDNIEEFYAEVVLVQGARMACHAARAVGCGPSNSGTAHVETEGELWVRR